MNELKGLLTKGRILRLVEEDIYSVLPDDSRVHHYDRRATLYDLVVGTRLYNLVMWGNPTSRYTEFVREAIASRREGRFLDAACGSLLFTAEVYLDSARPVIAFDQSLAMLRRARRRLLNLAGRVPPHVSLLQADLNDLPFRANAFGTILCMNVLHHMPHVEALIPGLEQLLAPGGQLYLTSLVANRRFVGDCYLGALHATGEVVRPRSNLELKEILEKASGGGLSYRVAGNMAFATTAPSPRSAAA